MFDHKLISGDNHIDLTYCPADLWSSQAPQKWKRLAPRVEERNDGQHWFVDDIDRGMWNGVGPGFLPYTKGAFDHIDEMAGARVRVELAIRRQSARPTTPELLSIADLDPRDGLGKGDHLRLPDGQRPDRRVPTCALLGQPALRTTGSPISPSAPTRTACLLLAIIPNTDSEGRGRRGAARCAKMGLKGGDLAFKRMTPPLYHTDWFVLWEASSRVPFPIFVPLRPGSRRCARPTRPRWKREVFTQWRLVRSTMFKLATMEELASFLASGACEKYPDCLFFLGESGVTWLP